MSYDCSIIGGMTRDMATISSVQNLTVFSAGDLLKLLDVSSDEKVLPTTYGELRPPLGRYRLKVRSLDFTIKMPCMVVSVNHVAL